MGLKATCIVTRTPQEAAAMNSQLPEAADAIAIPAQGSTIGKRFSLIFCPTTQIIKEMTPKERLHFKRWFKEALMTRLDVDGVMHQV